MSHPAGEHRPEREHPAQHEDIPAEQVQLGKGKVAGAEHHGQDEVACSGGHGGNEEEKHHHHAVHREGAVIAILVEDRPVRIDEVESHQRGRDSAQQKEHADRDQVENGDALVVGREEPRFPAVIGVEIVQGRPRGDGLGNGKGG